jgi:hypothetical protein
VKVYALSFLVDYERGRIDNLLTAKNNRGHSGENRKIGESQRACHGEAQRSRVYIGRAFGRYRDNRVIDGCFAAGPEQGQDPGKAYCVFEQPEAACCGLDGIRG